MRQFVIPFLCVILLASGITVWQSTQPTPAECVAANRTASGARIHVFAGCAVR